MFRELPGEILLTIGDYLDGNDYRAFRLISRKTYNASLRDVWSHVEFLPISFPQRHVRTQKCSHRSWDPLKNHTCEKRFIVLDEKRLSELKAMQNHQSLLGLVSYLGCSGNSLELLTGFKQHLVNLNTIAIDGRNTTTVLSLLNNEFKFVARIFLSGTFKGVENLLEWPELCTRMVELTVFFGIEKDYDMLIKVGQSLSSLEQLTIISLVNPRMIHIDDLVHFMRPLKTLKRIEVRGPIDNADNYSWIPSSVVELSIHDNDLENADGFTKAPSKVETLYLSLGAESRGIENDPFVFENLENLHITTNFPQDGEDYDIAWVARLISRSSESLRNVSISCEDPQSIGWTVFAHTKTFPKLESFVFCDLDTMSSVNYSAYGIGELFLPQLVHLGLRFNSTMLRNPRDAAELIRGLVGHSPHLFSILMDIKTLQGISPDAPSKLLGNYLSDKYNNVVRYNHSPVVEVSSALFQ